MQNKDKSLKIILWQDVKKGVSVVVLDSKNKELDKIKRLTRI